MPFISVVAAETGAFYHKNSAKTVFAPEAETIDNANLHISPESTSVNSQEADTKNQDSIEGKYGNPEAEPSINVKQDAPAPFKGLMAALEQGDDALAFRYAKQWARYLKNYQERVSKVTGVVGLAMESEGILGKDDWQSSKEYTGIRNALKDQLDQLDTNLPAQSAERKLASEKLIEDAFREELSPSKSTNDSDLGSSEARLRREAATNTNIRDERGEVDLLFFFRPQEKESIAALQQVEMLYRKRGTDKRLRFMAIAVNDNYAAEIAGLAEELGLQLPVKASSALTKQFSIKSTPTVVLVAKNSGEAIFERGFKGFYYLDEAVSRIQGSR